MVMALNLKYICQKLKGKKPPYKCPAEDCGKVYKSFCGIQIHLYKYHKSSTQDECNLSPTSAARVVKNGDWPMLGISSSREPVSDSKNILTFKANGKILTIDERLQLELCDKASSDDRPCSVPLIQDETFNGNSGHSVKKPVVNVKVLEDFLFDASRLIPPQNEYHKYVERTAEELNEDIEYDMDEEDYAWLDLYNERRRESDQCLVANAVFEFTMDRFEKESYFLPQSPSKKDRTSSMLIDEDAVCAICWDGECQNSNAILFCDMCNLAVHQDCYGVPLIPVSEWLCQRCLHSPSRAVDCCLCPNKGGAFKLTDCGLWAHVVCALWIPEVTFANAVYLEPIENIKQIHPARWSLPCYICKQRRRGACIQCLRQNCRASFHVTCAQQAGLYMKIIPVLEPEENEAPVSKVVFCHAHVPPGESPYQPMITHSVGSDDDDDDVDDDDSCKAALAATTTEAKAIMRKKKITEARIILAERRKATPTISIPVLSTEALTKISSQVHLENKDDFLNHLKAYWTLKRQSRNGVPLLRRLQINHKTGHQHKHQDRDNASKSEERKTGAGNEKFKKNESSDHKNISDTNVKRIKLDNGNSSLDLVNCKYEMVDVKNEFQMECKPPKSESAESKSLIKVPLLSDRSCTSLRRSRHTSFVSKSPLRQRKSKILTVENKPLQILEKEKTKGNNSVSSKSEVSEEKELDQKNNILVKINISKRKGQKRGRSVSGSPHKSEHEETAVAILKKEERKLRKKKKFDSDYENIEKDPKFDAENLTEIQTEAELSSGIISSPRLEVGRKHHGRKRKHAEENNSSPALMNRMLVGKTESAKGEKLSEGKTHKKQKLIFESNDPVKKRKKVKVNHRLSPGTSMNKVAEENVDRVSRVIKTDATSEHLKRLKVWQQLRRGLEMSRLLLELIQKREKHKLAQIIVQEKISKLKLKPFSMLLHRTLDQLQEKDKRCIFAQPVSVEDVPDYLDHIKCPMDFSTMRTRVENQKYQCVSEFQSDFDLIISNCMTYNAKDTIYYSAAVKLSDQGQHILDVAKKAELSAGYDQETGLHLDKWETTQDTPYNNSTHLIYSESREGRPLGEQLQLLQDRLNETEIVNPNYSACASWQLKKKIAKLRRRLCVLKSNIRTSVVDDEQKLASDASEIAVEKQSDADDVSLSPHLTRSALARRSELKPEVLLTSSVIQTDILNSVKTSSQGTNDDSHSVAQTYSSHKLPPAELKNTVRNFSCIKRSRRGRKRREDLRMSPQSDSVFMLPEFDNSTGVRNSYEKTDVCANSRSDSCELNNIPKVKSNKEPETTMKLAIVDSDIDLEASVSIEKSDEYGDHRDVEEGLNVKINLLEPIDAEHTKSLKCQRSDESLFVHSASPVHLLFDRKQAYPRELETKQEYALVKELPQPSLCPESRPSFGPDILEGRQIENNFEHLVLLTAREIARNEESEFSEDREVVVCVAEAFDSVYSKSTDVNEETASEEASVSTIILDTEPSDLETRDSLGNNSHLAEHLEHVAKPFSELVQINPLDLSPNVTDEFTKSRPASAEIVELGSSVESTNQFLSDLDDSSSENSTIIDVSTENQQQCRQLYDDDHSSSDSNSTSVESISCDDSQFVNNVTERHDKESEDDTDRDDVDDDDDDDDESVSGGIGV